MIINETKTINMPINWIPRKFLPYAFITDRKSFNTCILLIAVSTIWVLGCTHTGKRMNSKHSKILEDFEWSRETDLENRSPDSALYFANQVIQIKDSIDNDSLLIKAYLAKGAALFLKGLIDSSNTWYEEALILAQEADDIHSTGQILCLQANNLVSQEDYAVAKTTAYKALSFDSISGEQYTGAILNCLGNIYHGEEKYDSAIVFQLKALDYFTEKEEVTNTAIGLGNIATTFLLLKQYDKALEYLNKAKQINDSLKNMVSIVENLNNLGIIYREKQDYDSAIICYNEAIKLSKALNNKTDEIIATFNLGNVYSRTMNYQDAKSCFDQVYNWSIENKHKMGQIRSLVGLGANESENGSKTKAIDYYKKALKLSKDNNIVQSQKLIILNLGSLLFQKAKIDTINYFNEYYYLTDSIAAEELEKKVLELETKYQTQKKEAEIKLLQQSHMLERNQRILWLLISCTLAILIVFTVILFRWKQQIYKQRNQLAAIENNLKQLEIEQVKKDNRIAANKLEKRKLEVKVMNQELIFNSLAKAKLTNVWSEMNEQLIVFGDKFKKKNDSNEYKKLLRDAKRAYSYNPLDEFEDLFTKSNPGFYNKLVKEYKTLSPRELQICALISLNMQTKDISLITGISTRSLETIRHRIRKKMKLSAEQNLTTKLIEMQ